MFFSIKIYKQNKHPSLVFMMGKEIHGLSKELNDGFARIGVSVPEIILPDTDVDLEKWAVIACDQYTSEPDYWNSVKMFVGDAPSTLSIMLPEIYLEDKDVEDRILAINERMRKYLREDIMLSKGRCFIYVNRRTAHASSRKGLIVALDLEHYDYNKDSNALIRATEGTVVSRLPPRIKIRENSPIELPHIMVLIDDPERSVIEPLEKIRKNLDKLYDFDLMMDSGHIKGYKINDEQTLKMILEALTKLTDKQLFMRKYGLIEERPVLLFAMGDGNHSLATAKALWDMKKKRLTKEQQKNNPARYALVELVNVHDQGLKFAPIHRVLFNHNEDFFDEMKKYFAYQGFSFRTFTDLKSCRADIKKSKGHSIIFITKNNYGLINVSNPKLNLEVGTLQAFLDVYIKSHKDSRIDYIHGSDVVEKLAKISDNDQMNTGFLLPAMPKTELFKTVILDGVLPRKTFSMGEASEKRFYLEARRIQ